MQLESSQNVLLRPQPLGLFNSTSSLEPQMIQQRTVNSGFLFLDSQDPKLQLDKTKMIMSSIQTSNETGNTLISGVIRLKISSFILNYVTPNVNPRNNVITFFSSNTLGVPHSVTIPEGFYSTSVMLMDEIIIQLNTLTGSTGLTFSYTVNPIIPDVYNLNAVGGFYFFSNTSLAAKYGFQLYNLPLDQNFSSSKVVGRMMLLYTRYIDVTSQILNKYVKIRNIATNSTNNIIYRIYLGNFAAHTLFSFHTNLIGFNFHTHEPVTFIDFELRDEFGMQLYVPPINNQLGFYWSMTIFSEI